MAYSLPYFKFRKSLEREIRDYWSIAIAADFSNSWLNQFDSEKRITQVAENIPPYSYVDIKCSDYVKQLSTVIEHSRENALVNFITAFEVYLFEILSRIVYLRPENLANSEMKFDAKEIVSGLENSKDFKLWFSDASTDKTVRNKQHTEIIARIAKMAKCDLKPMNSVIEEWNKWTYVRNAIVHSGRRVSSDLKNIWQSKFPTLGAKLNIPDNEIMKVQSIAMAIAKHLENRINKTIIDFEDASLLVRELFARNGIDDINQLKRILQKNISYRAKKQQIEKALSFQRKAGSVITEMNFDGFINEVDIT